MKKGKILAGYNKHYAQVTEKGLQLFFDGDVVEITDETPDRFEIRTIPRSGYTWIDSEFIEIIED